MPDNSGRLAGRRILITGAASGIGRTTARIFVAEGAKVALLDANADPLKDAARETGGHGFQADVTRAESVTRAVAQAAGAMGGIDGVVNGAGIFAFTPLADSKPEDWQRIFAVNLMGPVLVSQAALPWLREAEAATIVNISSVVALRPSPRAAAYVASKTGLLGITRSLAIELGPKIRVNAVCPGTIDTPMARANLADTGLDVSTYTIPRMGTAEEIALGILYLSSAESSYVTGTALPIEGGRAFY
jgi:NAD(P)-dependent dehydrogenase (short-subunit alcohol dehydrogenase family)